MANMRELRFESVDNLCHFNTMIECLKEGKPLNAAIAFTPVELLKQKILLHVRFGDWATGQSAPGEKNLLYAVLFLVTAHRGHIRCRLHPVAVGF